MSPTLLALCCSTCKSGSGLRRCSKPLVFIRRGGGGARSALWRQIQADIYGQCVERVEAEEGAAYGAAILAGVAIGVWPSVEAACDQVVRVRERICPDQDTVSLLERQYRKYQAIYPALRRVYSQE